jgi:hypothetical protein
VLLGLQAKLAAVGTAIVAIAALLLRLKYLKNKTERLERVSDTLKARHQAEQTKKKLIKKERERLVSRSADIAREIEKPDSDFSGIDSLGEKTDDF